jgi:hypothetical protein
MTDHLAPGWKALCAELLLFGEQAGEIAANEGLWPKCDPGPDWLLDRTRAALAQSEPVPVTKRLPGPGDCDAEGRCWLTSVDVEPGWVLDNPEQCTNWTHWRPHHALPVPQQEAND